MIIARVRKEYLESLTFHKPQITIPANNARLTGSGNGCSASKKMHIIMAREEIRKKTQNLTVALRLDAYNPRIALVTVSTRLFTISSCSIQPISRH